MWWLLVHGKSFRVDDATYFGLASSLTAHSRIAGGASSSPRATAGRVPMGFAYSLAGMIAKIGAQRIPTLPEATIELTMDIVESSNWITNREKLARMAIEAGVPVIPVAMIGTYEIQPTGQVWPKLGKITVAFGEPIDLSEFKDRVKDPAALREATNRVMVALQALSGQQYVDIYATKAKEILANPEPDLVDVTEAADADESAGNA